VVCALEGFLAFFALLCIPSDMKNQVFLGYSIERWILLAVVLLIMGFFIFLAIAFTNPNVNRSINRLFSSVWVSSFLLLIPVIILCFVIVCRNNSALLLRLLPVFLYMGVISIEILHYRSISVAELKNIVNAIQKELEEKRILFPITITACIPLLFISAIKNVEPLNFAGLYTLMAEEVANANFHLPMQVEYYIPGDMPFAYPPLGIYVMAAFLKAGVPAWTYLRFAPPVFSLLAMIPLFLLMRRLTKSELAGVVTVLLAAGAPLLFYMQTESGGVVRGLAFCLGLTAVYFFDRMLESFRVGKMILAGVFFGLTILTHFGYSFYFAFWLTAWTLSQPQKRNWTGLVGMGLVSLFVILPWLIVIIERYGFSVLTSAFQSHNTTNFLTFFQHPENILTALRNNLNSQFTQSWLLAMVICGLILLLINKKFTLPLLFGMLVIFNSQGERFIILISSMIIGSGAVYAYRLTAANKFASGMSWIKPAANLILLSLLILYYRQSFITFMNEQPLINQDMEDAGQYLTNNSPAHATFLPLFSSDNQSDEWLPFLSQRHIAYPRWGYEWIGNTREHLLEEEELLGCIRLQSKDCLGDWFDETNTHPDFLIITTDLEQLIGDLQNSPEWTNVYSNERYCIWEHN
jgi:hypothetical protein